MGHNTIAAFDRMLTSKNPSVDISGIKKMLTESRTVPPNCLHKSHLVVLKQTCPYGQKHVEFTTISEPIMWCFMFYGNSQFTGRMTIKQAEK